MGGMTPANPARTLVEIVKAHRDQRGEVFEPLDDAELAQQKNVHVVLTHPNEVRGNHCHRAATETTTVVGPCLVRLKEADAVRDVEVPAGATWRFTIPPGVAHAFRNTGDGIMVLVSFSTRVHDPAGGDTLREQIL
jgi:dTDP-4-dehydrorhamnose 3,5-epimerase-like enzyme